MREGAGGIGEEREGVPLPLLAALHPILVLNMPTLVCEGLCTTWTFRC